MKLVLFLDALDLADIRAASSEMYMDLKGSYDVGVPRVTPNIVSQAMTGKKQEDMEFVRPTPLLEPSAEEGELLEKGETPDEEYPQRRVEGDPVPGDKRSGFEDNENILGELDEQGIRVFQYGIPFASGVELENGLSAYDEMNDEEKPEFMNFPDPATSFRDDEWELIMDCYVSDTVMHFEAIKQIARQDLFDVMFFGYKHLDHCTHWYFPECRYRLIKLIWEYIKQLRQMGVEVMWWSDHGSTEREEVFNINKWLRENGYLSYEVDGKFIGKLQDYGMDASGFEQQLRLQHPAVDVDWEESVAYSTDAFDAMVDRTESASEEELEELKADLEEHPAVDNVWRKHEKFDEDAEKFCFQPELIVERASKVLVTSNVHPDVPTYLDDIPEDWEDYPYDNLAMRPGVHSKEGCFGGDIPDDAEVEDCKPYQLKQIMMDFIEPESIDTEGRSEGAEEEIKRKLGELGYL